MGLLSSNKKVKVAPETVPPKSERPLGASGARGAKPSFWARFFGGRARRPSKKDAPDDATAGPEVTIMLIGCDGAGKTTLSAALAGRPLTEPPKPSSGLIPGTAKRSGSQVKLWDLGGGERTRGIWDEYYSGAHGAIFLVDAADAPRFAEARELLHQVGNKEVMRGKPMLVLANKQDKPQAVGAAELADALRVHELDGAGGGSSSSATTTISSFSSGGSACHVAGGRLDSARVVDEGSELDRGLAWLLEQLQAEYPKLKARVEADVAREEEEARKKREERKARVAARKKEREEAEAAAEAAAAAAAAATAPEAAAPAPADPPPSPPVTARPCWI